MANNIIGDIEIDRDFDLDLNGTELFSAENIAKVSKNWADIHRKSGRAVFLSPHALNNRFHGKITRDAWYIESDNKYTGSGATSEKTAGDLIELAMEHGYKPKPWEKKRNSQ